MITINSQRLYDNEWIRFDFLQKNYGERSSFSDRAYVMSFDSEVVFASISSAIPVFDEEYKRFANWVRMTFPYEADRGRSEEPNYVETFGVGICSYASGENIYFELDIREIESGTPSEARMQLEALLDYLEHDFFRNPRILAALPRKAGLKANRRKEKPHGKKNDESGPESSLIPARFTAWEYFFAKSDKALDFLLSLLYNKFCCDTYLWRGTQEAQGG
ncbi:hypothetical protein [Saccharibacillus sacchari]|uniref:Uncharacterized protein n=1 Tax=Saccharibacillus sacchari TaxID=456493 RepID=A0ACC6PDF7_9BACL